MAFFVLTGRTSPTDLALLHALRATGRRAAILRPAGAGKVRPSDSVLGRIAAGGGLEELSEVERRGAHVLNPAAALAIVRDEAMIARALAEREVPWGGHVAAERAGRALRLVVARHEVVAASEHVVLPAALAASDAYPCPIPSHEACAVAIWAAAAVGLDLCSLDLVGHDGEGYVVSAIDGSPAIDAECGVGARDPFAVAAALLARTPDAVLL